MLDTITVVGLGVTGKSFFVYAQKFSAGLCIFPLQSSALLFCQTHFTGPFNLTGLPAVSVPCGFINNLPIGMQIIGPAFEEARILNVAHTFEQIHPELSQIPSAIQSI